MNDLQKVARRALRFLVLFVVAPAATGTVIAAVKLDEAQAIREIERLGGQVKQDDKLPGRPVTEVSFRLGSPFGDENVPLLTPLTRLTTLDLTNTELCGTCIPDSGLNVLTELKSLRTLILNNTKIGDSGLEQIRELKNLRRLGLGSTRITDAGLKELSELKNLVTLDLSFNRIGDTGLRVLRELKSLTSLDVKSTQTTDATLKELRELKNLNTLDLASTRITDAGFKAIQELKSLRSLNVGFTGTTDAGLRELRELENLANLDLRSTRITGVGLDEMKELKNLRWLDVGWTDITNAGLTEIGQLKSLTSLTLTMTKITDAGLEELGELTNLATLDLAQTQLTGTGFEDIQKLKNLTSLNLRGSQSTGAGLAGLKTLTALRLGYTPITDAGLKELRELRDLKSLDLGGTRITDAGLKELKGLKNLTSLDVSSTQITDAGLKDVRELKNLTSLDVSATQITDAGLKELRELNDLTSLDLGATSITDAGLKELRELKNLESLNISTTGITVAGLKELKQLKQLKNLQSSLADASIRPGNVNVDCPGNDVACLPWGFQNPQQYCYDGSRLLVARDSVAHLLDLNSGKETQRYVGHQETLQAVLFSPDGTQVLAGGGQCQSGEIVVPSHDNSARLWEAATGKEIRRFEGHTKCIDRVEFSPDARRILTSSDDHTLRVWDARTGKQLLKIDDFVNDHFGSSHLASFTPDGRGLVFRTYAGRQVCVLDIETGAERLRLNCAGQWSFYTAATDPGGKLILTACTAEDESGHPARSELRGGKYVMTPSTQRFYVRTWNANTGKLEHVFQGHHDFIQDAAFSSDGKEFITASHDGTVRLWPTAMAGTIRVFRHGKGPVLRVFLSPDRKKVFAEWSDEPDVLHVAHGSLWDVETGKELRRFGEEAVGMAGFSPDSTKFVIANSEGCATVLSAETGAILRKMLKFARY